VYPKGFLVGYSTSFGNDADSFTRVMGKKATLIDIGGEGSQRWKLVEEKGTHEDNPFISPRGELRHAARQHRAGLAIHRRQRPVAYEQLAGLPAQPAAAECQGAAWIRAFGGGDYGYARVSRGAEGSLGPCHGNHRMTWRSPWGGQSWPQPRFRRPEPAESRLRA